MQSAHTQRKDKSVWHMRRALRLAKKGLGMVMPNPMVGAVIVKEGTKNDPPLGEVPNEVRIGEGWHQAFGGPHAEVNALADCTANGHDPRGATMYVTLEPCCHTGKTPPCTDAIIKSGIKKVVVAMLDPSEKVSGKGVAALREAGIEVTVGTLEKESRTLNRTFFTFHEKKRPFITLKVAMSLDGKIAKNRNEQTWLTGKHAQKQVHIMRSQHDAILVGAGTVLADNPHLGVRLASGRDPLRVILQGKEDLPPDAAVFRDSNHLILQEKSAEEVVATLHERGVTSLLVEGGQEVFSSFLAAKLVDEIQIFVAPIILGEDTLPFLHGNIQAKLHNKTVKKLGEDVWITANLAD